MQEYRSIVVIETDPLKFNTGILNMYGNLITRIERKEQIGFVRFSHDNDETSSSQTVSDQ